MKNSSKVPSQNKQAAMSVQIIILMKLIMILTTSAGASEDFPVAKHGCDYKCGNVTIPYPFGVTEECYYSDQFFVTCNRTSHPPELLLDDGNVKVKKISLDGKLRIMLYIAADCYNQSGPTDSNDPLLKLADSYTVSDTDNVFVAIGCDTTAKLKGYLSGHAYTFGCISICDNIEYLPNDTCSGIGCCQTSLPEGVKNLTLRVESFKKHQGILGFNPCSFAFVVEKTEFKFSTALLNDLKSVEELPTLLEWSVGEENCETAKKRDKYACQENSECYEPKSRPGYRCKCTEGYRGNPYLPSGCRDIDECLNATLNNCAKESICVNSPGSYQCHCLKGHRGDGREGGEGCVAVPNRSLVIPLTLGIGFGLTTLLVAITWLIWGINKWKMMKLREKLFRQNGGLMLLEISRLQGPNAETAKIFTAKELESATNKYDDSRILGQGGYGTVYKGYLVDGRVVAVKKSKIIDQTQISQFINEMVLLSRINHKNVVKLLGCCLETEVPLLVYEFITNGTLFEHIHSSNKAHSLTWEVRLRIAAETAGVLSYLHSDTSIPIIHRDMKCRNILLDENYVAKVSDFGISRLVPKDQVELATVVQGTLGYLDPEYMQTCQLTTKSDVYSFGVVLVELLTGQKALSSDRDEEDRNLAWYFLHALKEDRLMQILDDQIVQEGNTAQLIQVANLARRCLRVKGEERPTMKEVAMELERLQKKEKQPSLDRDIKDYDEIEYFLHKSVGSEDTAGTSSGYDCTTDHTTIRNGTDEYYGSK